MNAMPRSPTPSVEVDWIPERPDVEALPPPHWMASDEVVRVRAHQLAQWLPMRSFAEHLRQAEAEHRAAGAYRPR